MAQETDEKIVCEHECDGACHCDCTPPPMVILSTGRYPVTDDVNELFEQVAAQLSKSDVANDIADIVIVSSDGEHFVRAAAAVVLENISKEEALESADITEEELQVKLLKNFEEA